MLASSAFIEKGKFGHLVSRMNLLAMWFWFLFFMMSCGIKLLIGGLDYRRMISCCFLKDGGFTKRVWLVKK
jgi:hypothetical protein